MLLAIKAFFAKSAVIIVLGLAVALGGVYLLYNNKSTAYDSLQVTYTQLKSDKENLDKKIKEEQKRHAELKRQREEINKQYLDVKNELMKLKTEEEKKKASEDPVSFQNTVQSTYNEFSKKLLCVSGDFTACSKK